MAVSRRAFLLDFLPAFFLDCGFSFSNENIGFEVRIPCIDRAHAGVFPHVFAIALHSVPSRVPAAAFAKVVLPRSKYHACGEPLYVPLPGSRRRLVEVVDVENEPAFGRAEASEIADVTVAAGLHAKSGSRRAGEIESHQSRCASKERKGRLAHSSVANRKKLRQAPLISVL